MLARTIVVYGPKACGKTKHRDALARHFGCTRIVDDFDQHRDRLTPGALHLAHEPCADRAAENFAFADLQPNL